MLYTALVADNGLTLLHFSLESQIALQSKGFSGFKIPSRTIVTSGLLLKWSVSTLSQCVFCLSNILYFHFSLFLLVSCIDKLLLNLQNTRGSSKEEQLNQKLLSQRGTRQVPLQSQRPIGEPRKGSKPMKKLKSEVRI